MKRHWSISLVVGALLALAAPVGAQEKAAPGKAATVNGEAIPLVAVERALRSVPPEHKTKVRKEVLNHLIDNTLMEQFLVQRKVAAAPEEVEARLKQVKDELKARGEEFSKFLEAMSMTEAELRAEITAALRWETFVGQQGTDEVLKKFFAERPEWFDGSLVRARHILVEVKADADAKTREAAKAKLAGIKKQVDTKLAAEMTKLDPKADTLTVQQAKIKALSEIFAEACKDSDCPSKKNGGDLGPFPRIGSMVEPFAAVAYALKPGDLSDVVETEFGYHLILVTGRLPGKTVKFDDVKDEVREIYGDRLREEMLPHLRKAAKIEIAAIAP